MAKRIHARSLGVAAVVLVVGLVAVTSASAGPSGRTSGPTANAVRKCSLTKIDIRRVGVTPSDQRGFDYRVQGRVHVRHPGKLEGCRLKVCEAEELGRGNWVPSFCSINIVGRPEHRYKSGAPYVQCSSYDGTGWFASYARFEDSGVRALGEETRLCKHGKPVH